MMMLDECVGHMTEKVVIPAADTIEVEPRRMTTKTPEEFRLFATGDGMVPEMVHAGDGYKIHVTGLTHNEKGYAELTTARQDTLVRRLWDKVATAREELASYEEEGVEGADVVVISYGITSRIAQRAAQLAEEKGLKVGRLRLITVWPFPEQRIREIAKSVKALVVPELNLGQISLEVERCAAGAAAVLPVTHAGGSVHDPKVILAAIEKGARS
jgi:2-oxoglutarate/2-oxoacid ferredoxin oxidoreductase subunit alpha